MGMSKEAKQTLIDAEVLLLNTPLGEVINFDNMFTQTSYGKMTDLQAVVVKGFVEGNAVFDLGAGDSFFSKKLLKMGAKSVLAIEKEPRGSFKHPGLKLYKGTFNHFLSKNPRFRAPKNSVAFISWPANHQMEGLVSLMNKFDTVIYLGKNTDGTSCAWPEFYRELVLRRPLINYTPQRRNSLLVYGQKQKKPIFRHLVLEEIAGIDYSKCYPYEGIT